MWHGRINPGHCGERRAMQRILSIMVYAPDIAAGLRRRRGGSAQNAPGSLTLRSDNLFATALAAAQAPLRE